MGLDLSSSINLAGMVCMGMINTSQPSGAMLANWHSHVSRTSKINGCPTVLAC
jgi:hypothetical protein